MYIGKSEKAHTRVNEHLVHTKGISTYGLKLIEQQELFRQYEISFSVVTFSKLLNIDKAIIQFVISEIKKQLRGILNPWVGKQ